MASVARVSHTHTSLPKLIEDYLDEFHYDQLLCWFLGKPIMEMMRMEVLEKRLYVLDFNEDTAPKVVLKAAPNEGLSGRVLDALKSELPPSSTRLVILFHEPPPTFDIEYPKGMSYVLNLDPCFLSSHFLHNAKVRPPALSHSDTRFLQFEFLDGRYITTCAAHNTVVIFYHYGGYQQYLGEDFVLELRETMSTKVSCLQSNEIKLDRVPPPIDIVATILQTETLKMITQIDIEDSAICEEETRTVKNQQPRDWDIERWKSSWRNRARVEASLRSLRAALVSEHWSKGNAPLAKGLLRENDIVLDRLRFQGEHMREDIQQVNTVTSIEETRRGIQQSDSVRRLTLVAFVFIPLNFTTSFFGMNVQQLGTGKTDIGYFFLAAALTGAFTALLSCFVKPLERRVQDRREEIAKSFSENITTIQKREILRQSTLVGKLYAKINNDYMGRLLRPGPKFRLALRLLLGNYWWKLTKPWRKFKEQQAESNLQIIEGISTM